MLAERFCMQQVIRTNDFIVFLREGLGGSFIVTFLVLLTLEAD